MGGILQGNLLSRRMCHGDISSIVNIATSSGLVCDSNYIRSKIPEGVVLECDGRVVGFCGLIPTNIWVGELVYKAYILGMLMLEPNHGSAIFTLLEGVSEAVGNRFVFANTANAVGAKIWTNLFGMKSGPIENSFIRYRFILPWLWRVHQDDLSDSEKWECFIKDLQQNNKGLMTERTLDRWRQLNAKCVTVLDGDRIIGAAFVRARLYSWLRIRRCDIIDICAVNNDKQVLKLLLRKCCKLASSMGGVLLEYVGSPTDANELFSSLLKRRRKAVSNTFVYKGDIDVSHGWFFGPYDGDMCIS